MGLFDKR